MTRTPQHVILGECKPEGFAIIKQNSFVWTCMAYFIILSLYNVRDEVFFILF